MPKRLYTLFGHVARAKAQFEEPRRSFKSELAAELDAAHQEGRTGASDESTRGPLNHPRILDIGNSDPTGYATQEQSFMLQFTSASMFARSS